MAKKKKMTNKIFVLILVWSLILGAWVWASPPAGRPGETSGLIAAQGGKIGIGLTSPATPQYKLDVVGPGHFTQSIYSRATNGGLTRFGLKNTIREWTISNYGDFAPSVNGVFAIADETAPAVRLSIDTNGLINVNGNKIINVGTPTNAADAATKAYVDAQTGGANTSKVWGEGRPGTDVIGGRAGNGECRAGSPSGIRISRSTRTAEWGNAAAACPAGWWVCSATDRDINGAVAGYGACGAGARNYVRCDTDQTNQGITITDEFYQGTILYAWLSNTGSTDNNNFGLLVDTAGGALNEYQCSMIPVWCCSL